MPLQCCSCTYLSLMVTSLMYPKAVMMIGRNRMISITSYWEPVSSPEPDELTLEVMNF